MVGHNSIADILQFYIATNVSAVGCSIHNAPLT